MAKQLHFNKDGSALKKMQAGVDKLASVVGITLGPKVCGRQHSLCKLPQCITQFNTQHMQSVYIVFRDVAALMICPFHSQHWSVSDFWFVPKGSQCGSGE